MKQIPKNGNNEDFLYIRKFNKINTTAVCRKLKINRAYIMKGNGTDEQYKLVRKELENQMAKLYLIK